MTHRNETKMKRAWIAWACSALVCAWLVTPAMGQEGVPASTTRAMVDQRLAEMKDRLELSDYTWEQVHLILKTSIRERIAIAKKYGLDGSGEAVGELSSRDKRKMRRELKHVRKSTEDRMERYLSKDQMKEFKAMQEEIHEGLLTRMESRGEQLADSGAVSD